MWLLMQVIDASYLPSWVGERAVDASHIPSCPDLSCSLFTHLQDSIYAVRLHLEILG